MLVNIPSTYCDFNFTAGVINNQNEDISWFLATAH